jgi:hypothetical protein
MIETPHPLAETLASIVAGYTWQPVLGGCSGMAVYRLACTRQPLNSFRQVYG